MTWLRHRCAAGVAGLALAVSVWAQPSAMALDTPVSNVKMPAEHVRGVEQTFLTYPEWFLVFSPAEYASYVQHASPDQFPFMGHVGQFWAGYKGVVDKSWAMGHDLNPGYHLMVMVIGVSTTVEYTLRAVYESTLGALSSAIASGPTPEDRFSAHVAQDYVDFIRVLPWYEFDFWRQLKALWADVPMTGQDMVRKWERRFALTMEYGIKVGYAHLIKLGTQSVYDPASSVTAIRLRPLPAPDPNWPEIQTLAIASEGALVTVPRYDAFMAYALALALKGVDFQEIAGNDTVILVSLIGGSGWRPENGVDQILFEQPILTQPGRHRVVATVLVPALAQSLREWAGAGVQVEHIFDY